MQNFIKDESGAVTVDWVVLTAALVGLGLAVMGVVATGVETTSTNIDSQMTSGTVIRTSFTGNEMGAYAAACGSADCSGFASGDQIKAMSNADLFDAQDEYSRAGLATRDDVDATYGESYTRGEDGSWGFNDSDGNYVRDDGATTSYESDYAQASANDSYGSALQAESNARPTYAADTAPTDG
ncbi:Flp family type IVb pilin [Jannaschia sp. W003]|uniref:Flp family type IVb pilin n=1 Tax=Jannaschia sp. W003 TaxID=2867012 RepID=UPI0021A316C5|nr:hypothetical protein [Jannaschia sp. W003]UWQ23088.1 hypothetical protein K3554_07760 [Jannaschia sp. W003]